MNNDINNIGKVVPLPTLRVAPKQQNVPTKELTQLQQSQNAHKIESDAEKNYQSQEENDNVLSVDFGQLKQVVKEANSVFQQTQRNLQFKVDEDTHEMVVKIVDKESGEVIRQIPSEEMLALIKRMQELEADQQGLVIRDKA
jgi:flagellar protein FlaG